jgi:hypothetical protein
VISPATDHGRQVLDFMDKLATPLCEFAVDPDDGKILFKGGFCLEGANYSLFHALLEKFRLGKRHGTEIAYFAPAALATRLRMTDASLRQQVRRLRHETTQRLSVDFGAALGPDGIIENRQGEGYRLSNVLREVSLGSF